MALSVREPIHAAPARASRRRLRGTTFSTTYEEDGALFRLPRRRLGLVAVVVALVVYPLVLSEFWVDMANLIAMAVMGAIALNLLLGVAGQLSLGSAAFMGIGGFTAATFAVQITELPFLLTIVLAAVAGGLAAIGLGLIALRIRGLYLVLATIALHYMAVFGMQEYQDHTVGPAGYIMPSPSLFGWSVDSLQRWYVVLVVCAALTTLVAVNLMRSRSGRAWQAIKDRDIAASIIGVNVTRMKLLAFVVTSVIIGIQGALQAYYVGVVSSETYTLDLTIQFVAMIIIGGLGSVFGSVLGAIFVTAVPFIVRDLVPLIPSWFPGADEIADNTFAVQAIIFGLSIIVFMRVAPRGLVELFRRLGRLASDWPFRGDRLGGPGR
jgi:branched-chain amino acid transport system permease protein